MGLEAAKACNAIETALDACNGIPDLDEARDAVLAGDFGLAIAAVPAARWHTVNLLLIADSAERGAEAQAPELEPADGPAPGELARLSDEAGAHGDQTTVAVCELARRGRHWARAEAAAALDWARNAAD